MRLYHGSENIITVPKYGFGKTTNDYGRGFYCTENLDLASEWAVEKDRDGFANCYEIETNGLTVLNLSDKEFGIMEWMAILLTYRDLDIQYPVQKEAKKYIIDHFFVDVERYDIITGYRADDSFFSFTRAFLGNTISYNQLKQALHLGNLGQQIVLKSKKAFDRMEPRGYIEVSAELWYARKQSRDLKARKKFNDMLEQSRIKGDIYIVNIMDEEIDKNDPRLR